MATWQLLPDRQKTFAADAAFFVMVAIFTTPALASTAIQIPCTDAPDATLEATLEVTAEALVAKVVNHNIPISNVISDDEFKIASSESLLVPLIGSAMPLSNQAGVSGSMWFSMPRIIRGTRWVGPASDLRRPFASTTRF